MKVKINNIWYDANDVPICIQMDDKDKKFISNLKSFEYKYAVCHPDIMSLKEFKKWMNKK